MDILLAERVLTGPDLDPIDRGVVAVEGETIVWVGREADMSISVLDNARVTRYPGTLMPGLIDAHVHLGFDGGPKPVERMKAESDAQQVALMLRSARELLSVGVTSARDLGARNYLDVTVRDAIADGTARGPRMVTAGSPLTPTGGHCWFMGGECDSENDVRQMVRRHHKAGVNAIKVMATGGNMTAGSAPWHAQFTTTQLRAVVDESHRLGKRVAAHAHGVEGIRRSLDAGMDSLEHCSFQSAEGGSRLDPELADRVAESRTFVSPTCNFRMTELRAMMPDHDFPLGELYRRGARIIASSDAGIDNTPHYGFAGGLMAMADFGIPAKEVLISATSRAAEALDLDLVTGRLTPGYSADIIAVAGDPTTDLALLSSLDLVLARGRRFIPDELEPLQPLPTNRSSTFLTGARRCVTDVSDITARFSATTDSHEMMS